MIPEYIFHLSIPTDPFRGVSLDATDLSHLIPKYPPNTTFSMSMSSEFNIHAILI